MSIKTRLALLLGVLLVVFLFSLLLLRRFERQQLEVMLARSQPDRVELIARWVDLTGQSLRQFSYDSPWSETVESVANRETGWATINREASLPNFAAHALGVIALDGSVISGPIRRVKTRGRPPSPVRIWRRRPPTILFPTPSLSTLARSSRSGDRRSSRPTTPSFRSGGDRRLRLLRSGQARSQLGLIPTPIAQKGQLGLVAVSLPADHFWAMEPAPDPRSRFRIWGTAADTSSPVQTIGISGNGPLDATVYAANAKLRVKGGGANGQVSGAVVANNLSLVGGSKFHYNEALADTTAGNPYGLGA